MWSSELVFGPSEENKELKWNWMLKNPLSSSGQLFNQSAFYQHASPAAKWWWCLRTVHKRVCAGCIPIILHSAEPNTYGKYWRIFLPPWTQTQYHDVCLCHHWQHFYFCSWSSRPGDLKCDVYSHCLIRSIKFQVTHIKNYLLMH